MKRVAGEKGLVFVGSVLGGGVSGVRVLGPGGYWGFEGLVVLDGWPVEMPDRGGRDSSLLGRICEACVRSIPVTGAAVSLMTSAGHRVTAHASDGVAARLDDLHFDLGEGPGIDAFRGRCPVLVPDLGGRGEDASARWPAFAPAALAAGAGALFAFPVQLGAVQLGVLLLYGARPAGLDAAQHARALRLADAAFYALLDRLGGSAGSALNGHRADADVTLGRAEVYQAAGMVMVQLGVSIEEATVRLHAYAFASDRPLVDVARDVVGRHLRLDDDNVE
jgi:hypothetical protein